MARRQQFEDRIIDAMAMLSRVSESYMDDLAAVFSQGLGRGTIQPLTVLHRLGPTRVSALAEALGLDRTTVTRHLDVLESHGLITRRPDERDRRAMLASLTSTTAKQLDTMRAKNRQRIRRLCSEWTPEEREVFEHLLTRFALQSCDEFSHSSAT
ncbi:MarR family winged helix-turn-helix transcriptional regulator [Kibdelosporangium aridum]|uniref:MarR family winged helix-turn-helix transcriptional regulator n=1 Tax=Kibdelosporangium aridum TaxID=2030 RepID=UPI00068F20E7